MNFGFYIYIVTGTPAIPHAWFAELEYALAYVNDHGSSSFKLEIVPAGKGGA